MRVLSGRADAIFFLLPRANICAKHPLEPFRLLPHEQNDASAPPPSPAPVRCVARRDYSASPDLRILRPKTSSLYAQRPAHSATHVLEAHCPRPPSDDTRACAQPRGLSEAEAHSPCTDPRAGVVLLVWEEPKGLQGFRGGGGRGGCCLHAHDPVLSAPPAVFPDDELRAVSRAVSRTHPVGWTAPSPLRWEQQTREDRGR